MAKPKIMIIEDEILVAMTIRNKLTKRGYEVCQFFTSGEEALKNIEKEKPDIVLMDINLEGKMNGIETAQQINKTLNIPIIYVTGYSDKEIMDRAKASKPAGYLIKPFDFEVLLHTINSVQG